jgi:hypothetical protein
MASRNWQRLMKAYWQTSPTRRVPRRTRIILSIEQLESRLTPSTLTVNSLLDTVSPSTGSSQVTLRDAVLASENHTTDNLGDTGTGDDTIVFSPGLAAQNAGAGQGVIALSLGGDGNNGGSDANGPSALLITDILTIVGPTGASGIAIARASSVSVLRLFETTTGGRLTLQNLTLTGGTAHFVGPGNAGLGGGVFNAGTTTLTNCSLSGNSSDEAGGGISTTGTLTISGSILSANSAINGGGCIFAAQGKVTISNSTLSGNSTGGGGSIESGGLLVVSNSVFSKNQGGAINNLGGMMISDSTFSGNFARAAGAVYTQDTQTSVISDSTFSGNSATFYGGGAIQNYGGLAVNNCTFSANTARGDISNLGGGAIDNMAALAVSNSTFSANSCEGLGGGIDNDGTLTVSDSTLSANRAYSPNPGGGGGSGGGGIYNFTTATLSGDIIDGNFNDLSPASVPDDIAGEKNIDTINSTNNLIGVGGADGLMDGQNGNQVGVSLSDVGLAPLENYGGPTQTFALLPGSFAIAKGLTETTATVDQRGAARPIRSASDVGAFQDEGYTLTPTNTPQSANLNTAFAQPLLVTLSENFANDPLPGATILFTGPTSGPSAALSSPSATDDNGQASVTATANNTPGGPYTVTTTDAGTDMATFDLTNTNPEPTLTSINPSQAAASSPDTTITLTGTGFVNGSTADFNGTPIATTFVSATQLTAVVPAADLTTAGMDSMTVVTAGPGGGTSDLLIFNVTSPPAVQLPPAVSVAFGPAGEVLELVNSAGFLTQVVNGVAQPLGNGGVRYASIAYGPNGAVVEVVGLNGVLTQFINGVAVQLGNGGVSSASVAFVGSTEVMEVVGLNGVLTQFINGVAVQLGNGGVSSASVAYVGNTQVLEVVSSAGVLTQFTNGVPQQLGGAGVQSAGVAFNANSEVLDIIFSDGSLDQFDAFGVRPLGMVS